MNNRALPHWQTHSIPLSMLMLSVLALFTVFIFTAPYTGFYFDPADGVVLQTYHPTSSILQTGDVLVKIGDVSFQQYQTDFTQPLFPYQVQPQDVVPITLIRNGVETTVEYSIPGFNLIEFRGRIFNIWWLAYIFWIFAAFIEAFIRPRKTQWWLLLLSNHITGLWVMLGSFSSWHLFGGSVLFHALTWLILPIYLHLNWIFPKPFRRLPKTFVALLYLIAAALCLAEIMQALPNGLYLLGALIALVGSVTLQIIHYIWKPEDRRKIRLLVLATALACLPLILMIMLGAFGQSPDTRPIALLSLLFIPSAYIYLITQNQLGEIEVRANLFISAFAFLILIGACLFVILHFTSSLPEEVSEILDFVIALFAVIFSIRYFPRFQRYIEKRFLGVKLDSQTLQEEYISRIIASASLHNLLRVLETEVFPSLLIRQYAFAQFTNGSLKPLLTKNVSASEMPQGIASDSLLERSGKFIPEVLSDHWIRLILPLQVDGSLLGFFLLGQRHPDTLYHQTEIPILQAIANQTAIAFSNSLHAEQLKQMYELGAERYEEERKRLARDLHDSVLHELSEMRRYLGKDVSPEIQTLYHKVISQLREIVHEIRSPMLVYGLAPAIKALAENLMQKTNDAVKIIVDIHSAEERMPEKIEALMFRIVEEACKNSLEHAQARWIKILGSISPNKADLLIEDDGIGFEMEEPIHLGAILAKRHFGLVGMVERAHIIGAKLKIEPKPHTKIHILWDMEKIA